VVGRIAHLSIFITKTQFLQVLWSFDLSSLASSTLQANGCLSRSPISLAGNGIRLVSLNSPTEVQGSHGHLVHHHVCSGGPIHFNPHSPGRRLDPGSRRACRCWPVCCVCPYTGRDERWRKG
jgi:hypothetical protein